MDVCNSTFLTKIENLHERALRLYIKSYNLNHAFMKEIFELRLWSRPVREQTEFKYPKKEAGSLPN